jgi:hypothetical protein
MGRFKNLKETRPEQIVPRLARISSGTGRSKNLQETCQKLIMSQGSKGIENSACVLLPRPGFRAAERWEAGASLPGKQSTYLRRRA